MALDDTKNKCFSTYVSKSIRKFWPGVPIAIGPVHTAMPVNIARKLYHSKTCTFISLILQLHALTLDRF